MDTKIQRNNDMTYKPVWDGREETIIRVPDIRFIQHKGQELVQAEFGFTTLDAKRNERDIIWGYVGDGNKDCNRRMQYRSHENNTCGYSKVKEVLPFWRCALKTSIRVEIDKFINSFPSVKVAVQKLPRGRDGSYGTVSRVQQNGYIKVGPVYGLQKTRKRKRAVSLSTTDTEDSQHEDHDLEDHDLEDHDLEDHDLEDHDLEDHDLEDHDLEDDVLVYDLDESDQSEEDQQHSVFVRDTAKDEFINSALCQLSKIPQYKGDDDQLIRTTFDVLRQNLAVSICPSLKLLEVARQELVMSCDRYEDVRETMIWTTWTRRNNIRDIVLLMKSGNAG